MCSLGVRGCETLPMDVFEVGRVMEKEHWSGEVDRCQHADSSSSTTSSLQRPLLFSLFSRQGPISYQQQGIVCHFSSHFSGDGSIRHIVQAEASISTNALAEASRFLSAAGHGILLREFTPTLETCSAPTWL